MVDSGSIGGSAPIGHTSLFTKERSAEGGASRALISKKEKIKFKRKSEDCFGGGGGGGGNREKKFSEEAGNGAVS